MKSKMLPALTLIFATGCLNYTPYYVKEKNLSEKPTAIIYSLPKARVFATVKATYTQHKPGVHYAMGSVLGLNDGALLKKEVNKNKPKNPQPLESLEVKSVKLTSFTVPDQENSFAIHDRSRKRIFVRKSSFSLTSNGRLKSSSVEVEEQASGAAVAVLSVVVEVAEATLSSVIPQLTFPTAAETTEKILTDNANKKLFEDYKAMVGSDWHKAKFLKKPSTWRADYERLMKLKNTHEELFLNSTPPTGFNKDHAALARVEINKEIERLLQKFGAKTIKKELEFQVLLTDAQLTEATQKFELKYAGAKTEIELSRDGGELKPKACQNLLSAKGIRDKGIIYRIPRTLSYNWASKGQTTPSSYIGTLDIPQFGECAMAPNTFRGRRGTLSVTLDQETGMLTEVTFERAKLFNAEAFQAVGEGVGEVIGAIPKEEKEDPVQDEIDALEKDLERRKLQRAVKCFEETGAPCPEDEKDESEE